MKILMLFLCYAAIAYAHVKQDSILINHTTQYEICDFKDVGMTTNDTTTQSSLIQSKDSIAKDYATIKPAPLEFKTLNSKSTFARFKIYEPFYVLPAYYSFSPTYDEAGLTRTEIKIQIGFRLELLSDLICKYCAFSVDYVQKFFLQSYNPDQSSPLRDIDLSPGFSFIYKRPLGIVNGKYGYINWLAIGYLHTSNGERENINPNDPRQNSPLWNNNFVRSKSFDRIYVEANYRYENFNARLRAWVNNAIIAFDGERTNGDIADYLGYGDLRLSYAYKNNLFEFYINNIFNNYFTKEYWSNWKGQIELGYSYGITKTYAIYVQYLYGHGDSLYEYSLPVNRIGIGLRLRDF